MAEAVAPEIPVAVPVALLVADAVEFFEAVEVELEEPLVVVELLEDEEVPLQARLYSGLPF